MVMTTALTTTATTKTTTTARSLLLSLPLWALGCSGPDQRQPPTVCNGSADSCARRYDQVTIAATHNAFSYAAGGPVKYIYPNQDRPISDQLAAGIRGLGIRPCPYYGDDPAEMNRVYVTHNFDLRGLLGTEPLADILDEIRDFLDQNPDEVVTLYAESAVTPDQIADTFMTEGLGPYLYTYDPAQGWPTLSDMIVQNTRLVVFNDSQDPGRPPWMLYLYDHIVDTDYNITSIDQFSCAYYRGKPDNELYYLNNFIYDALSPTIVIPSQELSQQANDPSFIVARAGKCAQQQQRTPSVIYVDWYGQGDVVGAVRTLNAMPR